MTLDTKATLLTSDECHITILNTNAILRFFTIILYVGPSDDARTFFSIRLGILSNSTFRTFIFINNTANKSLRGTKNTATKGFVN